MTTAMDLTIAEAIQKIAYGASCTVCDETRRIDLATLPLPADTRVRDIRQHLRCAKCGKKDIIAVTLWLDASTTNLMVAEWK